MPTQRTLILLALTGIIALPVGCQRQNTAPIQAQAAQDKTEERSSTSQAKPSTQGEISTPPKQPVASLNGAYDMEVICDTNPELRITKVEVTDTKTIIDLAFKPEAQGDTAATSRIRTAAPGQMTAFYISDPDSRTEYRLLNVEGIALEPNWMSVTEGREANFTLTFERIPDTMTRFHLIEGKVESHDEKGEVARSWTFMNVRLK